jgi:hypothetical protein
MEHISAKTALGLRFEEVDFLMNFPYPYDTLLEEQNLSDVNAP